MRINHLTNVLTVRELLEFLKDKPLESRVQVGAEGVVFCVEELEYDKRIDAVIITGENYSHGCCDE